MKSKNYDNAWNLKSEWLKIIKVTENLIGDKKIEIENWWNPSAQPHPAENYCVVLKTPTSNIKGIEGRIHMMDIFGQFCFVIGLQCSQYGSPSSSLREGAGFNISDNKKSENY